jgi:hypothetical protein
MTETRMRYELGGFLFQCRCRAEAAGDEMSLVARSLRVTLGVLRRYPRVDGVISPAELDAKS